MVMDGLNTSIIGRAVKNGLLSIEAVKFVLKNVLVVLMHCVKN